MGIPWLSGAKWEKWTREERYFCAVLFHHGDSDPRRFARWIIQRAGISQRLLEFSEWDLGYEVCFYRDFLWEKGELSGTSLPLKRTFDLCLFAAEAVVVIEAKGFEHFSSAQNEDFKAESDRIRTLLGKQIEVHLVALASSHYLTSDRLRRDSLAPFTGSVSWKDAAAEYRDPRLMLADGLYRRKSGNLAKR